MVTLLLAVTLGAGPTVAVTTPVKKTAADYANAQRLLEPLREALRAEGFTVLTAQEVQARAPATSAADCGRNRTCLALFAGALDVQWLVTLETEAVEKDLAVAISALSPQRDERPEMTFFTLVNAPDLEERVRGFAPRLASIARQYGGLPQPPPPEVAVTPPATDLTPDGHAQLTPPPEPPPSEPGSKVSVPGLLTAGAAGLLLGGGAFLLNDARSVHADLSSGPRRPTPYTARQTQDLVDRGERNQLLGLAAVGVGAAAAATSLYFFTRPADPHTATGVSLSAGPGGVSVLGSF